ncbi:hypothetical protein AB9P05_16480 [Roseivirga sp. BDSF3-8]|uniref:hypothetical protein n=1 Tax=Roseivirga sp. BDSF3-8 TaxID=3241598 RepID=UPI003531FB7C
MKLQLYTSVVLIMLLSLNSCQNETKNSEAIVDSTKHTAQTETDLESSITIEGTESLPIIDEFADTLLKAIDYEFYLVETEKGYDYVKGDLNNDGKDGDVAVLLTKEANPQNYTSETEVFLLLLREDKAGNLQQLSYSGELGGESIQYKDDKKLTWNDGVLTYIHQSMRNHMEIDIKVIDIKTKIIDKVSICYYSDSGCEDLYVASESQDTIDLHSLNMELLDSLK